MSRRAAAELAATVRDALTRRGTGSFQFPPNDALTALDELAALAAENVDLIEWHNDRQALFAAEAENTRLRAALEQIETTTYALNETLEAIVAMKGIARDALAAATAPNPQDA
jgi:molecular chaperone GrpE (heat shock protein)